MNIFGSSKKKKRPVKAQIAKEMRLIAKQNDKKKLAALRKQRRGY